MKQLFHRSLKILLAVIFVLSVPMTALAGESTVTWQGEEKGFGFAPGSTYTDSDLFGDFKDVMPGDLRTQTIILKNEAKERVKFYLRAKPHEKEKNSMEVVSEETISSMEDFLAQLTLRVYNGNALIYEDSPQESGDLTENVFLGELSGKESLTLKAELVVPLSLGNQYAKRIGEVDWVFTVVEFEAETGDSTSPGNPSGTKPILGTLIQTGQLNWPIAVLAGAGILLLLAGCYLVFGKRKHERE